jgi:hypothetical protein
MDNQNRKIVMCKCNAVKVHSGNTREHPRKQGNSTPLKMPGTYWAGESPQQGLPHSLHVSVLYMCSQPCVVGCHFGVHANGTATKRTLAHVDSTVMRNMSYVNHNTTAALPLLQQS